MTQRSFFNRLVRFAATPKATASADKKDTDPLKMPVTETWASTLGIDEPVLAAIRVAFDPDHYLAVNPDVKAAGLNPLAHFLTFGASEERSPNSWFNPKEYRSDEGNSVNGPPFFDLARKSVADGISMYKRYNQLNPIKVSKHGPDGEKPVTLLLDPPKREVKDLVSAHFNREYYLSRYSDVEASGVDPVVHYLTLGWIEGRDPAPEFSTSFYLEANRDIREAGLNPFVHYLRIKNKEKWRRTASVAEAQVLKRFGPKGEMRNYVAEAMALEPMVGFPRTPRQHTSPLVSLDPMVDTAVELRHELRGQTYEYVVTVPHIRMSGAARVAAIFTRTLAEIVGPHRILVLVTDDSEMPYAKWFPSEVALYDLSARIGPHIGESRVRMMLDVLRGIEAKSLINVNSRLCWEALQMFGRQMSQEFRLITYLFTWDETPDGERGGYPIQWLRDTADLHHVLLTDTEMLASDIRDRFGYSADEVVALFTPVEVPAAQARLPEPGDAPKVLWAGRFDHQKRVDVLVAIARANPHIVFDVYGKAVLDAAGLDAFDPPANIRQLGTYQSLEDVFVTPYAAFIYTAQWDGMPTIILDMAQAGLPVIAPRVGGIGELIDETTGWLIEDFTDVEGYSDALSALLKSPDDALKRTEALQARMTEMFSPKRYQTAIKEVLSHRAM